MIKKILKWACYVLLVPAIYVAWLLMKIFLFDYFTVPSSSMTPTITPGSKVIVNKLTAGPRLYTAINFKRNGNELHSVRLKGTRGLHHNDIVVFNFPLHGDKISFVINHVYCKRITGLPGDTLTAVNGHLYNNNYEGLLGCEQRQRQLEGKTEEMLRRYKVYDVAPRHDRHFGWNIQNWGPLYVPRRGDIITVTPREATLYRRILEWETGAKITYDWDSMAVFANGRRLTTHLFRHNYYHICGDYSLDSFDSRYWGFVPEEYIIGVVAKIIPPRESK
ncbi:MAG: signal peptidase I [Prevotella sp.]|nr:signal peptidase I [Prevotella sp.]